MRFFVYPVRPPLVPVRPALDPGSYRVVLFGDSGVGKTALVSQFMTSEYIHTYDASLGKPSDRHNTLLRTVVVAIYTHSNLPEGRVVHQFAIQSIPVCSPICR